MTSPQFPFTFSANRIVSHFPILLTLLTLLTFTPSSPAQATQGQIAATRAWHPDKFIVSFWCSPPEPFITVERYKQIADAGFNYVMPICGPTEVSRNQKMLTVAEPNHLKVFIEDKRMPMSITSEKDKAILDSIVHDYSHYPAFGGYFVTDEPLQGAFAGLGQVVAYLREKDPAHPAFINLLPGYPGGMIGPTYDAYVEYFINVVHPWLVSYDHYHFTVNGDAPWFLENLESVARITKQHEMPFLNIVLATQHLSYRRLTEAEKRYEAMQTLAFGARGLLWFTYWQPDNKGFWKDAIINYDGKPTYQYPQITRINNEMSAFGNALIKAEWLHTWTTNPPASLIKFDKPDAKCTVGSFKQGATRLLFIANQDYKNPLTTNLHIRTGNQSIERFDPHSQKFVPDDTNHLNLEPAGAALYRWKFPE